MVVTTEGIRAAFKAAEKGYWKTYIEHKDFKEYYILIKKFPFVKKIKIGYNHKIRKKFIDGINPKQLIINNKTYDDINNFI